MNRLEEILGNWIVKRRWWIVLTTILVTMFAISGAQYLTFSNDARVYFSEANPQLQALENLENIYTKNDNILIALAPKDGRVFTPEVLVAVEELTESAWRIPYSNRVDSITNFQHMQTEQDELIVADLIANASTYSEADLQRVKKIALNEPLLVNRLISPAGHVTALNINLLLPENAMQAGLEVVSFTRGMVEKFQVKHPDIAVYLAGGVMIDNAFSEASEDDMKTLVPLMYLVLYLIMLWALRSVWGTLGTLLVIAFSMGTGMGLAGWLGIGLTASSVNAPTIILTLGVADSIHLLMTTISLMRQGKSKQEALIESIRINLIPVMITSVTTAVGFLTMNFSDAPPFRDLGNIVAIGILAALAFSIFFLPAFMAIVPFRVKPRPTNTGHSMDWLSELVIRYRHPLLIGLLATVVILTSGVFKIELNDNFIHYFDHRYAFRNAYDFLDKNLPGSDLIAYSLDSGETGGINDPEYLAKVEDFANWYRQQDKVVHVSSITDTIKRLNKNMHGNDENYYRIPENRELAAQYLLMYEMSLPFGLDLNDQINVAKSATRMTVLLTDMTAKELRQMDQKARQWLAENAPETMQTYGASMSLMFAHISQRNIESMLSASFGALVLISLIMIIALRSFKFGLLSLLPNLTPAAMAMGIWGLAVGRVGLVVSVQTALTLGIVVDDTVHFMSKYLRARREYRLDPEAAVRYSFNTVGTAMWVTTAILVAGFMVLSLSGFRLNSVMGLMTTLTIAIALVMDFLLLPTLLMKVETTYEKKPFDRYLYCDSNATASALGGPGGKP